MSIKRNRIVYGILIVLVVILGLLSRHYAQYLPNWLGSYSGDVLWALMVYLIIGFIFVNQGIKHVLIYSVGFSYAIELSQLYHARWIDIIRNTTIGGLVLGFGFLWSDLICYTIGIFIGALVEFEFFKK